MVSPSRIFCVGFAAHDFIFGLPTIPTEPTKHRATSFATAGGGNAATAAVAAVRLGAHTRLATRIGDDAIGAAMMAEFDAYGVDASPSRRMHGCVSPLSAILVDAAGERLIVNYVDPKLSNDPSWLGDLPGDVDAALGDVRWPEGSAHVLAQAKRRGLPAILDGDLPGCPPETLAAASLVAFSAGGLAKTVGVADIALGLEAAERMVEGVVMATDGARGVYWREDGRLRHQPAFSVVAVDTLGAGDVFHGALAVALAERMSLEQAARFACAAAGLKTTRFGGRAGAPSRGEVEALLRSCA
jgi:sulfofructose kinase